MSTTRLQRVDDHFVGHFDAMASPCELLLDLDQHRLAHQLVREACDEAIRIEQKFSRYRRAGVLHEINASAGKPVTVDDETADLLDYAATCHAMSGGLFDVTSGVLRHAWRFDGSADVPSAEAVLALRARVGWERVTWERPRFTLPAGMEIDFGGIGKEYAVDRVAGLLAARMPHALLVNFGGDLFASGPRRGERPWVVGVDDPAHTGDGAIMQIELTRGGLATSGDARRFVMHEGRRLGHILDPRTGWPVADAPRAVTVLAPSCVEAGTLATLACLQGAHAKAFLDEQGVTAWVA